MKNTAEIMQWADDYFSTNGYVMTGAPDIIEKTPWSSVTRFSTNKGLVFLKQTPPALSLEPAVTKLLHDQLHASVPVVIACNESLHCFLMKDAGNPLRETLMLDFDANLLCQAIKVYTNLQYESSDHIKNFIELGVPDWRLNTLPLLYSQIIKAEKCLLDDGLTINDLDVLHNLQPRFENLCLQLQTYKISESLDHSDFHDNNILISSDKTKITIIDLGETVIAHPFLSLVNCLYNAMYRYSFNKSSRTYIDLRHDKFKH
jgi:aminoglycoside/choline kinase family phosphotransferase